MKYFEVDSKIKITDFDSKYIDLDKSVFFDIETTGFSPKTAHLYLIGCVYKPADKDTLYLRQWFLEDVNYEKELIIEFMEFIKDYKYLITFNGNGFDIPFLQNKIAGYKLLYDINCFESIDIFKEAYKVRKLLKLQNLKQKSIEEFFGIYREDKFSGGDLISVYSAYLENHDERLKKVLLLHNLEDIKAMPLLLNIFTYTDIFKEKFDVNSCEIMTIEGKNYKKEFIIQGKLHSKINSRVSFGFGEYYFTAYGDTFKFKVDIYTGGLKYFYKEYKDYFYLPNEDRAVHKSVAFFVDKNFRTKAKAANCYSKKTGNFIPQPSEIMEPYFKIEYNDKTTYVELTKEFAENMESVKKYVSSCLLYLLSR